MPALPDMQHAAYRKFTASSRTGIRIAISFTHPTADVHHPTRGSFMLGSLENDSDVIRHMLARARSLENT